MFHKEAFIITLIAGLSTLLGASFLFLNLKEKNNQKFLSGALSFAAGVMLTISIIDLIPSSFVMISETYYSFPALLMVAIFIIIGLLIAMFIDHKIPSLPSENNTTQLYRVGIVTMLGIVLHNIPEGIATYITSENNIKLGITLAIAIAFHNIPEGISISIPIYFSTKSKKKAFFYTLISGLSEPFGAILAWLFLEPFMKNTTLGFLYAMIAGVMGYIAIYELIPSSWKTRQKKIPFFFFIIGIIFMIISHNCFA